MSKLILVIGATGRIGSELVKLLIQNGESVRAATRNPSTISSRFQKTVDDVLHDLFTYMQFPKQHWHSIKSTNVIESLFSAVKLRTDAARRISKRESALYLVFKLLIAQ